MKSYKQLDSECPWNPQPRGKDLAIALAFFALTVASLLWIPEDALKYILAICCSCVAVTKMATYLRGVSRRSAEWRRKRW